MPKTFRPLESRSVPLIITVFVIASIFMPCGSVSAFEKPAQRNAAPPAGRGGQTYEQWLTREVGHELNLLPWLTIFDNLQYQVYGSEVTLLGQVVNPVTKDDAEKTVKGIEGVTKVTDNIEVLPEGPMDWQIRRAEYRAIYSAPQLERYGMGTSPPFTSS
jgi:hypothetical protein